MAERSFIKDATGVFSTNIFGLLMGFIIGIILNRTLGPDGIGLYYAILAVPQITFSLVELGTRASIVLFTGKKIYTDEKIISSLLFIFSLSTIICIIIFGLVFSFLDNPDFRLSFIILIIIMTPLRLITVYARAFILGKEKIKKFNLVNWIFQISNLIGVVIFVWLMNLSVFGALLTLVFSSFVLASYSFYIVAKENTIRFRFDFKLILEIVKKGIVYALSFFIIKLHYRIDIILLERLSNLKEIGFYSMGVNIAEQIWQIPAALFIVIVSRSANASDQNEMSQNVMKLLRITVLLAIFCSILLYVIVPFVIPLVYGAEFLPSVKIVRYILPGILAFVIFSVLNSQLSGMGKPHISIIAIAPSVIVNIVLNLIWIPQYGGAGAAMATNVSYLTGVALIVIAYCKVLNVSISEMFGYKKSDFNFIPELAKSLKTRLWKKQS